jgi:intracellular sulfur oxidation DsrE/DsrF family protein
MRQLIRMTALNQRVAEGITMKTGFLKLALFLAAATCLLGLSSLRAEWPAPTSPAISEADGYVAIPNAAVLPQKDHVYRAIFDATQGPQTPTQLIPALNMAGSELNAFEASEIPSDNVKFVMVFHGDAVSGILDAEHYKAKFGVDNPNLSVLRKMKEAGVKLFVCGQQLAADKVDPSTLAKDVTIASDALIVLMAFQNEGYAVLSY